jgi:23S rRNA pseudouridine1911/1915/1917 synthase
MPESRTVIVTAASSGQRLDQLLRELFPQLSRRVLLTAFRAGHVRLNGRVAPKGAIVQSGDQVDVLGIPEETGPAADPELALSIIYEDAHLVALAKPPGVPSHALTHGERGTMVSALLARYPEMRGVGYRELESGLLHRLDNDTSGVLLAARDQTTFESLRALHEAGGFEKRYLALVSGRPEPQHSRVFLSADRRKVAVRREPFPGAKPVEARVLSTEPYGELSLVCVQLSLAARHQVRAQLAVLGHPIAGDSLYGGPSVSGLKRHFLHASEIRFPYADGRLELSAPLSPDLQAVLADLSARHD